MDKLLFYLKISKMLGKFFQNDQIISSLLIDKNCKLWAKYYKQLTENSRVNNSRTAKSRGDSNLKKGFIYRWVYNFSSALTLEDCMASHSHWYSKKSRIQKSQMDTSPKWVHYLPKSLPNLNHACKEQTLNSQPWGEKGYDMRVLVTSTSCSFYLYYYFYYKNHTVTLHVVDFLNLNVASNHSNNDNVSFKGFAKYFSPIL